MKNYDPVNMKSLDNADDGDLYDPIKLNYDVNEPRLENVEFLDPGIIDLDEDFHFIDENTTDNDLLEDATGLDSVTTTIHDRVFLKPMSIKLVDCYKFPWYFDQFTKNIIKNKLIIGNDVNNSEQIMDISSNKINYVYEVGSSNAFAKNLGVNETSKSAIDVNSNELSNDSNVWKQAIDINRERESLGVKLKILDHNNRLAYTKMKNDLELLNAMSQRNKTGIDIKRNTGLVGLKVKSMTTKRNVGLVGIKVKNMKAEKQASDMQNKANNTDILKEKLQETNNMYIQAVDKTLIDLGTTIAPVYIDIGRHTEENELTVSQDARVSSKDYFSKKVSKKLDSAKIETDMKYVSTNRNNAQEEMLQKINKSTKIAQEIIRMVTSESGELGQMNDGYKNMNRFNKPMPNSKKIENKPILTHLDRVKENLKHQKDTKECKSIKIIKPMPLSKRKRNKEKLPKSIKINEALEKISPILSSSSSPKSNATSITIICNNPHDMEKQETEKSKASTMIPFKPDSPNPRSVFHVPNKSFSTLNKFTENILSKIQAKKKLGKLDKKHSKNHDPNVQSKSTNERKSISGVFRTKSNDTNKQCEVRKISKMAIPDMHPVDNTAKDGFTDNGGEKVTMNPEIILTQPNKLKKNNLVPSTKKKLSHPDLHYNSLQNMLPLNTIVMNTAKTDGAKINVDTNSTIKSSFDYATNSNSPGNKSESFKDHSTTNAVGAIEPQKQSFNTLTQKPNTATPPLLDDKFAIQTAIAIDNELDTGEVNHAANNFIYQTHVPKAQVSDITTTPKQKQNYGAETNKPLAVHNSMQSHILYSPQAESRSPSKMFLNNTEALCYQNPKPQINLAPGNSMCYPSWYTELVASLEAIRESNNGFNRDIPSQNTFNTSKNTPGNCENITTKIEINSTALRFGDDSPSQSIIDVRKTPLGFNGHISPLMERNVRNHKGILPHVVMNNSPMLAGAIGTVLHEAKAEPEGNRMIPTHMAFNNKPTPPGACNVQPNTVFWSSEFPPPKLPSPPPAFSPYSQKTKIIPSSKETMSSSVLGRNDEGIIKKINISSQVFDHITETDSTEPKPNFSLPNGEVVAPENCRLATTKSEMLKVLDTSIHRMKSPVEPLPFKAKASPNVLKNSPHSPSFEKLTNISKNEKQHQKQPIPSESNTTNYIKQETPHKTFDEEAAEKITAPEKPNSNRVSQSKVPQYKSNRSSASYSAKLLENNPKTVNTSKTLTGSSHHKNIQSKAISINSEKVYTDSKKESSQIKINRKDGISSRKTNVASPVTLKRALTMDQIEKTWTVKYKPGPLSKKNKVFDPRESHNETKSEQKMLPNIGYSPPILPIPTYEKILSEVPIASNKYFDKPIIEPSKNVMSCNKADAKMEGVSNINLNIPTKRRKYDELISHKVNKTKKISLQEYKKRSASERKRDEAQIHNDSFNKKTGDMSRRMSQVDSDLGYDSDSTVKL